MNPIEFTLVAVFGLTLLGLAFFFGWRQLRVLAQLRGGALFHPDDQIYLRKQARRRLICSALMLLLGAMLLGTFFLEGDFLELSGQLRANRERDADPTGAQTDLARFLVLYWVVLLCLLFSIVMLAAVDVWAIARFGLRHHRQLQADHRDGLKRDVARLRQERNGYR